MTPSERDEYRRTGRFPSLARSAAGSPAFALTAAELESMADTKARKERECQSGNSSQ